jgi:hypothetical protein
VLTVPIGLEPVLVDGDVMVVPAEGDQVVGIGGPTPAPGDHVVDLEPVPTVATVYDTPVSITVEDGPAQPGRDGP